jgi:hypothetical protein
MPVNPSGKLERRELPSPGTINSHDSESKRKMTAIERAVAHVWSETLGLDEALLAYDSDFVAMGE